MLSHSLGLSGSFVERLDTRTRHEVGDEGPAEMSVGIPHVGWLSAGPNCINVFDRRVLKSCRHGTLPGGESEQL